MILAAPAAYAAAGESTYAYTPTGGPACVDRSKAHLGVWRCPGPQGYVAEYSDEGNLVGVTIWRPATEPNPTMTVTWRGSGRAFGKLLEWRIDRGEPSAAILRIWRTKTDPFGTEHEVEELLLIKLRPTGSCRALAINARDRGANESMRALAGRSPVTCAEDGL
jgi:hypothetical protein